jgi:hypothetical protein
MGVVQTHRHHHPDGEIGQEIEQLLLNREKHPFLLLPLEALKERSGVSFLPNIQTVKCQHPHTPHLHPLPLREERAG